MCNPRYVDEYLAELGFKTEILLDQERRVNPVVLNDLQPNLKEYFLKLREEGKSIFEEASEDLWLYALRLKKIYLI